MARVFEAQYRDRPGRMQTARREYVEFKDHRGESHWLAGLAAFKYADGHLARDRREALEEFFQRVVVLKVLKKRFGRHRSALEHRRTAENVRVDRDEVARVHARMMTVGNGRVKRDRQMGLIPVSA
jgi:hypothetical protein